VTRFTCQSEGDDGSSAPAAVNLKFLQQYGLKVIRINLHLTRRDLLVRRAVKAELTDAQTVVRPDGRPEGSTGDRARSIEFTHSRIRIQGGTGFIVREIHKSLFRLLVFVESPVFRIPGKFHRQPSHRSASPHPDACGAFWFTSLEFPEPVLESCRIELADRKHSEAALRAPWSAGEPRPAPPGCIGERSVHDLHQGLVCGRQSRRSHS